MSERERIDSPRSSYPALTKAEKDQVAKGVDIAQTKADLTKAALFMKAQVKAKFRGNAPELFIDGKG